MFLFDQQRHGLCSSLVAETHTKEGRHADLHSADGCGSGGVSAVWNLGSFARGLGGWAERCQRRPHVDHHDSSRLYYSGAGDLLPALGKMRHTDK